MTLTDGFRSSPHSEIHLNSVFCTPDSLQDRRGISRSIWCGGLGGSSLLKQCSLQLCPLQTGVGSALTICKAKFKLAISVMGQTAPVGHVCSGGVCRCSCYLCCTETFHDVEPLKLMLVFATNKFSRLELQMRKRYSVVWWSCSCALWEVLGVGQTAQEVGAWGFALPALHQSWLCNSY